MINKATLNEAYKHSYGLFIKNEFRAHIIFKLPYKKPGFSLLRKSPMIPKILLTICKNALMKKIRLYFLRLLRI